jgi:hypothetical protein
MKTQLSQFTIYTIRRSHDLKAICASGGSGQFTERKRWTSALDLFDESKRAGTQLPVVFAAGECVEGLIYWAVITELSADAQGTTYRFAGLRALKAKPRLSSLRLRSTGAPLSDSFIRPYAIVHTPDYIRGT